MKVRFQADADLDGRVLRGLRRAAPEIDIRTAAGAGLPGRQDPEVLRHTAAYLSVRRKVARHGEDDSRQSSWQDH